MVIDRDCNDYLMFGRLCAQGVLFTTLQANASDLLTERRPISERITILADELIVFQASQAGCKVLHAGGRGQVWLPEKEGRLPLGKRAGRGGTRHLSFGFMIDKLKSRRHLSGNINQSIDIFNRSINNADMQLSFQLEIPARRSRADVSRAKLMHAALTCFSRDGLEGASIREIAELAGQNTANISYYFGSKEGLYRAVLTQALRLLRDPAEQVQAKLSRLESEGILSPDSAIELLQLYFGTVFRGLIEDDNGIRIAPLFVREQTRPTPTFDLIYEGGLRRTHETLSRLVGIATGVPADDPRSVLRAHSLMGQFKVLITDRETLLRRMGWDNLKGKNADAVIEVFVENIRVLLEGLQRGGEKSVL